MTLQGLSAVLLVLIVIPAHLFPLLYLRSPWWRTAVGKSLMFSSVAFALFVDVGLARRLFVNQNPLIADMMQLGVFSLILIGVTYRLILLIRMQSSKHLNSLSKTHRIPHSSVDTGKEADRK